MRRNGENRPRPGKVFAERSPRLGIAIAFERVHRAAMANEQSRHSGHRHLRRPQRGIRREDASPTPRLMLWLVAGGVRDRLIVAALVAEKRSGHQPASEQRHEMTLQGRARRVARPLGSSN